MTVTKHNTRLHGLLYIGKDRHLKADLRRTAGMPLHSHDYFELEFLLEGRGRMEMNSVSYELSAGSVYFLTPADFHGVTLSKDSRCWNISFDGSVLAEDRMAGLFSAESFFRQVDGAVLEKLNAAARLLACETDAEGQKLLVEYLLRTAGVRQEGGETRSPIRRAVQYVETYFRKNPSLGEVAAHVGLSPSYFGQRFLEETGETFVSYLNRCKVNCAVMLLNGGRTVTEACFESGFGSLSGFRYVFRQKTGTTPKEYTTLK